MRGRLGRGGLGFGRRQRHRAARRTRALPRCADARRIARRRRALGVHRQFVLELLQQFFEQFELEPLVEFVEQQLGQFLFELVEQLVLELQFKPVEQFVVQFEFEPFQQFVQQFELEFVGRQLSPP